MSKLRAQMHELVSRPTEPADASRCEALIHAADAAGDVQIGFEARVRRVEVGTSQVTVADPVIQLGCVVWCLARWDDATKLVVPTTTGYRLLWAVKGCVEDATNYPHVPIDRVDGLIERYHQRLQREGYSSNAAHLCRFHLAHEAGDLERAARARDLWHSSPTDGMSDCDACSVTREAQWLVETGDPEGALKVADPHMSEATCGHQPHTMLAEMADTLVDQGRTEEAYEAYKFAWRRMPRHRRLAYTLQEAQCLHLVARLRKVARCLDLVTQLAPTIENPLVVPGQKLRLLGAMAYALTAATDAGRGDREILGSTVAKEAERLRTEAYALADQFDRRNGNNWISARLTRSLLKEVVR